jgi:hypothetical protein
MKEWILITALFVITGSDFEQDQERQTGYKTETADMNNESLNSPGNPHLYKKIEIPGKYLVQSDKLAYGGDIRMGDLSGNDQVDFLVYRAAEGDPEGATKPCFIGAFTMEGKVIWEKGKGGIQPYRPGPVAIHDIDRDGQVEVICFFHDSQVDHDPFSLKGITLQILNGKTGEIERKADPEIFHKMAGEGPNWVHQRILIANFNGQPEAQDIVIKLGNQVLAFNHELRLIWSYFNPWDEYQQCPAYIPAVGDIDDDGKDEVNGGYFLLDDDGSIMWEKKLGENMDAVEIAAWDNGNTRAICSGYGFVIDQDGNVILELGKDLVPHGQEMLVADFDGNTPGPEMIIRYNGHEPDVMLIENNGKVGKKFVLNESPNNTGMTTVYWEGFEKPAILFNGGVLWRGRGDLFAELPGLPEPQGDAKMGWYHCIPANVCGDTREEIITYNPWDQFIYIYTPEPFNKDKFKGYDPGPRQYNVRLMD